MIATRARILQLCGGVVVAVLLMSTAPAAEAVVPAGSSAAWERVDVAVTPSGDGAWVLAADGRVTTRGAAAHHGDAVGRTPRPFVGIAAHPGGAGYWLVDDTGWVHAFGAAGAHGQVGVALNRPVVGIAPTASGQGYWLAASDGGVFAFGDARYLGSMGGVRLNQPVVGITAARGHDGYWLVARDGGVFTFGSQDFHGSTGSIRLNQPIVAITSTTTGRGYWMLGADGGVFSFGDAPFLGSAYSRPDPRPSANRLVAIESAWAQSGYVAVDSRGYALSFGHLSLPVAPPPTPGVTDPIGDFGTHPRQSREFLRGGESSHLTDVRSGRHPGFDRIVLEFRDGTAEHRVRYVSQPPVDPRGVPATVAGNAMLEIHLSSATGWDFATSQPTYRGPQRLAVAGTVVRELARVEDFEANLVWVAGIDRQAPFALGMVRDPLRLVIDVRSG
ncbi:MAG: AMIN-like domain-containing (lipo)protein [Acidimicrobiales bacterium]